jgi:hypothetical protein
MATEVERLKFFLVRTLGMIQITLPDFQLSAQPVEIEIGERDVRAADIAHGTLQNRARTHMVPFGLVVKSDRQLNHALHMPAQRPVARQRAPDVFENFMRVEKVAAIEQIETSVELCLVGQRGHSGLASAISPLRLTIYTFP